jgi:hypothetical protein
MYLIACIGLTISRKCGPYSFRDIALDFGDLCIIMRGDSVLAFYYVTPNREMHHERWNNGNGNLYTSC